MRCFIFLPYILLSTNLFAAAISIPEQAPLTPPFSLSFSLSLLYNNSLFLFLLATAFVIVAVVTLVNALHFVATTKGCIGALSFPVFIYLENFDFK